MSEKQGSGVGGLIISEDVIAKMVSAAALETPGVDRLVPSPSGIKGMLRRDNPARAVHVKNGENGISLDVFLGLKHGVRITEVCEQAQKNIKNAVQNMTNKVVAKVNLHVVDVTLPGAEK